jgi:hypothetical protein
MTPKAELQQRVEEQDRQLQLIHKYLPFLEHIEDNVRVLQSLGLKDYQIEEAISRGSTYAVNAITNPQTGEEMAIYVEEISIQKTEDGQYGVFIGKVPYQEYFSRTLMARAKIEALAKEVPEIRAIYKENQQMRTLISLLKK